MKKTLIFLILTILLSLPVSADNNYMTQYNNVGAEKISDGLNGQTREFFDQNNIDAKNPNWVNEITSSGVFSHIVELFNTGIKSPIKTGVLVASIIFLSAALTSFGVSPRFEAAIYAAVVAICAIVATDVWQSVKSAVDTVKGIGAFMVTFVPVFASIVALSGKTVTAPAMSALLLGAAEVTSFVSSFVVLPLMGGYLALSIGAGVSPLLNNSGIVDSVKKLCMWIMSLLGTLFVGILGIQTAVNSAADSVALRTAKFILGTSVPVAGGVLSEAVSTISASMGLLRSSVGIYGVVAILFMLLPIVIELILWRCMLMLNISLGELFSLNKITSILRAVDAVLSVLLGVVLLIGGMFIISLSVVVTAGKT